MLTCTHIAGCFGRRTICSRLRLWAASRQAEMRFHCLWPGSCPRNRHEGGQVGELARVCLWV
jgi:hypothetical protein